MAAVVAGTGFIVELEIIAEHVQQMFFQTHHQRMNPGVEQDIRAFVPHLRRIARREVLNVDRGRDHRARYAQTLADMAFHLGAQDHLGLQLFYGGLDFEVVVGNQRLDPVVLGQRPDRAGKFAVVAAEAGDFEAHLVPRDARRGGNMAAVAEDEHALAGQVSAVDAARPPGLTQAGLVGLDGCAGKLAQFGDEIIGGPDADGHGLGIGLAEGFFAVARRQLSGFGVEQHVEVCRAHAGDVGGAGPHRGGDVDVDAQFLNQRRNLGDVVAVAEPQAGGAEDVAGHPGGTFGRLGQVTDDLQKRLISAKVFLALIAGQLQRDHRHRQTHGFSQTGGIVLDQLGRARGSDDQRLRLEAVIGLLARLFEQRRGVRPKIARLKRRVGDRRALAAPLDHREQQVGIGVALGRVQHIVQVRHAGGDTHRADMGRALICPDGQFHERRTRGQPLALPGVFLTR